MARSGEETRVAVETSCAEQLARFFPRAARTHIPVKVTAARAGNGGLRESAVLEFCDSAHAIFVSALPLEFDDQVQLEREPYGAGTASASVVAVQYHDGRKAVAIRFRGGPASRVIQP